MGWTGGLTLKIIFMLSNESHSSVGMGCMSECGQGHELAKNF